MPQNYSKLARKWVNAGLNSVKEKLKFRGIVLIVYKFEVIYERKIFKSNLRTL
jgi:deoxyribodipyrimidine photolyase